MLSFEKKINSVEGLCSLTNEGGGWIGSNFMAPWLQQVLSVRSASRNLASQNLHFWSIAPQLCSWISCSSIYSMEMHAVFQPKKKTVPAVFFLALLERLQWPHLLNDCFRVNCLFCRLLRLARALEAASRSLFNFIFI